MEAPPDDNTNVISRQDGVDSPNPNLLGPQYAFPFLFPMRSDNTNNPSISTSTSNSFHDSPLRRAG